MGCVDGVERVHRRVRLPGAVGCAVGFKAQPFASEWGKAEADDDHNHQAPGASLYSTITTLAASSLTKALSWFLRCSLPLFTERKL